MNLTDQAKNYDKEFKKKTKGVRLQDSRAMDPELEDEAARVPKLTLVKEDLKDWRQWLKEG